MAERLGLMNRRLVSLGLEPFDDPGRGSLICFEKWKLGARVCH